MPPSLCSQPTTAGVSSVMSMAVLLLPREEKSGIVVCVCTRGCGAQALEAVNRPSKLRRSQSLRRGGATQPRY